MIHNDMGVSINLAYSKWIVYKGESENNMDDDWGTPILGNHHVNPAEWSKPQILWITDVIIDGIMGNYVKPYFRSQLG